MEPVAFTVSITPRPKGRPRTRVRGSFATIYTPETTRTYEKAVKAAAEVAMGSRAPFWQPVSVFLKVRVPVPASHSKRERTAILTGEQAYYGNGDAENYAKSILDAFNGVIYDDDRQVCQLVVIRVPSEKAGIDVRISEFKPKDWI